MVSKNYKVCSRFYLHYILILGLIPIWLMESLGCYLHDLFLDSYIFWIAALEEGGLLPKCTPHAIFLSLLLAFLKEFEG